MATSGAIQALGKYGVALGMGSLVGYSWRQRTHPPDITFQAGEQKIPVSMLKYGAPVRMNLEPICYNGHCLEYDGSRRSPIWVAEHIERSKVNPPKESEPANRKHSKFRVDPSISGAIQSSNDDFWNSGWSRGHMAPAGNNKHCQKSMNDTFLLSNIVPQDFANNGDFWNRLEIYCRDLTKQYSDVRVISGPLWIPREPSQDEDAHPADDIKSRRKRKTPKLMKYEVIGANEVAVPTHLYKVVLVEDEAKLPSGPLLAAFVVPNKPIPRGKALIDFRVPVESIEKRLGYKFHTLLDRSKVGDLCEVEGCQMMDYNKFQTFYIERGMKGARNLNDLDRYWKRAVNLGLASRELEDLYTAQKTTFQEAQSKETSESAPAA